MNTTLDPDTKPVLDTSKMSAGQRAALEMTEAAREDRARNTGFAATLFDGKPDASPRCCPSPCRAWRTGTRATPSSRGSKHFLDEHVDPDEIDRNGEIPDDVLDGLAQARRVRHQDSREVRRPRPVADELLAAPRCCSAAYCGNLTALLSAHQIHRRAAAAAPLRHRGAEAPLPAARAPRARSPPSRSPSRTSAPIRRR